MQKRESLSSWGLEQSDGRLLEHGVVAERVPIRDRRGELATQWLGLGHVQAYRLQLRAFEKAAHGTTVHRSDAEHYEIRLTAGPGVIDDGMVGDVDDLARRDGTGTDRRASATCGALRA